MRREESFRIVGTILALTVSTAPLQHAAAFHMLTPSITGKIVGPTTQMQRFKHLAVEKETTESKEMETVTKMIDRDDEFVENLKEAALQAGSDFKDAAFKVGGDLFVALRWGAANALTKSLPDDEREELLQRISPERPLQLPSAEINGEFNEMIMKNSVNEAVAAALAEESIRDEARWEREKEQLLIQAEQAAQKRVESDLAVQKQRMELEKQQIQKEANDALRQLESEREQALKEKEEEQLLRKELEEKEKALQEKIKEQALDANIPIKNGVAVSAALESTTENTAHPILGPALIDFGYKRIHTVKAEKLATIPVWKKQRIYRHNRAKSMADDKLKTLHLGLPGIICLHEEENGKLSILDGQHRVGMMSILQERQSEQLKSNSTTVEEYLDLDRVLVEVYPQTPEIRSIDHAQDIFLEINKAEPVRVIDMPGVASKKDRSIISEAVDRLEANYQIMFSPSQRCRAPNMNIDNLRDSIFAANIIKRHNLKTSKQLYDWLLEQNKTLADKLRDDEKVQEMFSAGAWKKATANEFYLGLESSWLYN